VVVLRRKDVATWLRKQAEVLSPDDVDAIYDMARRSTTWLPEVGSVMPARSSSRNPRTARRHRPRSASG
jgi:hypothetical protein